MGLLLDQIREHGTTFQPPYDPTPEMLRATQAMIADVTAADVMAFEVSAVVSEVIEKRIRPSDLPAFRPPYPNCWVEAYERTPAGKVRWGMWIRRVEVDEIHKQLWGEKITIGADCPYAHIGCLFAAIDGNKNKPAHGPLCLWIVGEHEDGKLDHLEGKTWQLRFNLIPLSGPISDYAKLAGFDGPQGDQLFLAAQFIMPLYSGIGFLHVRNIGTEANTPPEKLQKARKRRNKPPLVEYHTLTVRPLSGRHNGSRGHDGSKRSIHFCRGHFMHATAERPLFGKPWGVGTFWVPAHIKGTREVGEVRKDYRVNPE